MHSQQNDYESLILRTHNKVCEFTFSEYHWDYLRPLR